MKYFAHHITFAKNPYRWNIESHVVQEKFNSKTQQNKVKKVHGIVKYVLKKKQYLQ